MSAIIVFILRLLLIILAYAFIAGIAYTIFLDLRRSMQEKSTTFFPVLTLHVEMKEDPFEKNITSPEVIIGRDPACDVIITDETISLRHCKLGFHNKQWWAEDLGSTNGSYLNETLIQAPIVLTDGDTLRLGLINISLKFNEKIGSKS